MATKPPPDIITLFAVLKLFGNAPMIYSADARRTQITLHFADRFEVSRGRLRVPTWEIGRTLFTSRDAAVEAYRTDRALAVEAAQFTLREALQDQAGIDRLHHTHEPRDAQAPR